MLASAANPYVVAFVSVLGAALVAVAGFLVKMSNTQAAHAEHLRAIDRALYRLERHVGINGDDDDG